MYLYLYLEWYILTYQCKYTCICLCSIMLAKFELTLRLPNRLLPAKFLIFFNFQSASISLLVGENVVWVSKSFDPDETSSYSASHIDPSCLHMALWLWLVGYELRAIEQNSFHNNFLIFQPNSMVWPSLEFSLR